MLERYVNELKWENKLNLYNFEDMKYIFKRLWKKINSNFMMKTERKDKLYKEVCMNLIKVYYTEVEDIIHMYGEMYKIRKHIQNKP